MSAKVLLILAALLAPLQPAASELLAWGDALVELAPGYDGEQTERDPVATVQVDLLPDAYTAELMADSLRAELEATGSELEVFVESVASEPDLPHSFRVGVGPFPDFEDAERARLELEAAGVQGFIRELEPLVGC